MKQIFRGPMATELQAFLEFKRSLGYGYLRAEFTLREFDPFPIRFPKRTSSISSGCALISTARPSEPHSTGP